MEPEQNAQLEMDRVSFEDSERFEDDSICSWQSENESLNQKWSEWNPSGSDLPGPSTSCSQARVGMAINSLAELCAQKVASSLTFEAIELTCQQIRREPVPAPILKRILVHCFPSNADNIRTYSFITNGSTQPFEAGLALFNANSVYNVFQIGYHISAYVNNCEIMVEAKGQSVTEPKPYLNVSIRVDRHIIAVCLFRIQRSGDVQYRSPIWDSITELTDEKLMKFAQYFINESPAEFILIAQKLLDQLAQPNSEINQAVGAPDPTAGGHDDVATWCMDEKQLHESIRKILISFVKPAPMVCDVSYMANSNHQTSAEFGFLLRSQFNRAPDPLWKLLEIVVHMLKKGDENATTLLHAITEHCLCVDQVLSWWYQTRLLESGYWHCGSGSQRMSVQSQQNTPRFSASTLCEEIVRLWGLCALNPKLSRYEKDQLDGLLQLYHQTAVTKIWRMLETSVLDCNLQDDKGNRLTTMNAPFSVEFFPGFYPALQLTYMDWNGSAINALAQHVDLTRFTNTVAESGQNLEQKCINIPILKHGPDVVLLEFLDTEQKITSTLNHQQYYDNKMRSKRYSRKKKRRRNAARTAQMALQDMGRVLQNQMRRDVAEGSEDSAAEDNEAGGSYEQERLKQEAYHEEMNHLFAKAHAEMDTGSQRLACCQALLCYGFEEAALGVAKLLANDLFQTNASPAEFAADANDLRQELLQKVCKHKRRIMFCHYCKRLPPDQICLAGSIQRKSYAPPPPPEQRRLQAARDVIASLKDALFVMKCLLDGLPICPLSANVLNDRDDKQFGFVDSELGIKLALRCMLMPRGPAPTKQLEMQTAFLELQLLKLVSCVKLTPTSLDFIRDSAEQFLRTDLYKNYTAQNAVPPVAFGHYILNALSFNYHIVNRRNQTIRPPSDSRVNQTRKQSDETLALAVALAVLEMRPRFVDREISMLLEYIRKQKGDLALELLKRNSDSKDKLNLILDRFLDPEVHCIYANCNTNAILVRACGVNHPTPFCLCWKQTESNLPRLHQPAKSESNSRRDSGRSLTETYYQTESSLQRLEMNDPCPHQDSLESRECENTNDQSGSSQRLSDSNTSSSCTSQQDLVSAWSSNNPSTSQQFANNNLETTPLRQLTRLPQVYVSEDDAHFLMEFSKRLLGDSGMQSTTRYFNANNAGNNSNSADRNMLMCSFIIGLYSLGVTTHVSEGWSTRTYSTAVSWIQTQAMDIGVEAVQILNDVWEAHLTPSEAAELADKAGHATENLFDAAAQLALNVLSRAWSLTFVECNKAISQCAELGVTQLEKACLAIEESAKHESLSPQVLFKVAEHWYKMHKATAAESVTPNYCYAQSNTFKAGYWNNFAPYSDVSGAQRGPPPPVMAAGGYPPPPQMAMAGNGPASSSAMPKLHVSHSAPNLQPAHPQLRGQAVQTASQPLDNSGADLVVPLGQPPLGQPGGITPLRNVHVPITVPLNKHHYSKVNIANNTPYIYVCHDPTKWRLLKAHEVGMRALEVMSTPNLDDVHINKFIKHPENEQDIKFLLTLSVELGHIYVQLFCEKVVTRVHSPYLLVNLFEQLLASCVYPSRAAYAGIVPEPHRHGYRTPTDMLRQVLLQMHVPACVVDMGWFCCDMLSRSVLVAFPHPRLTDPDELRDLFHLAKRFYGSLGPSGRALARDFFAHFKSRRPPKLVLELIHEAIADI